MALVGSVHSADQLRDLARATDPHVVVVGLSSAELPHDCLELLLERPRVRVLGIVENEGHAYLYELRPEQLEIGEVSPDDVVETIRDAVRRRFPL